MNDYLVTKELYHHGIKGQKWGYRRYQNEDGTFTEAGKERYNVNESGKITGEGKRKFRIDQRAIKGQREYEKGNTIGNIQSKKTIINTALGIIGGLSLKAAFSGVDGNRLISKGEVNARRALLGIGAVSVAALASTEIAADIKTRNMRSYYTNGGPRSYVEIKNKK